MLQNNNLMRRFGLLLTLSVLFMSLSMVAVNAQSGSQKITGLSSFVAANSGVIYLNSSLVVPFTVNLTSGTSNLTYLTVANGAALANNGINVGMNPSSGSPSFNGNLYVNTNVNPTLTVPGNYVLQIESGGADPINPGIFNFTLTVMNSVAPPPTTSTVNTTTVNTTTVNTTVATTLATTLATTIVSNQSNSTSSVPVVTTGSGSGISGLDIGAVVIVIIIILIIAYVATRPKKTATT
jgi:hypothetical protein